MPRATESDYQERLASIATAAKIVEEERTTLEGAEEALLDLCEAQIASGVPVVYVARAADINRTKLYRLLGRIGQVSDRTNRSSSRKENA